SRERVFDSSYGRPFSNYMGAGFASGVTEALIDPTWAKRRQKEIHEIAAARDAAGIVGFEFNLSRPLGPQIKNARDSLLLLQQRFRGKKTHSARVGNSGTSILEC